MVVIFIRTLIIYTSLLISMRLMGKRQIGQLDLTDLITTFLISQIASLPIENPDIPIIYALIPMVTLLSFEIVSSMILSKSQTLKNLFSSRPGFLIKDGEIDQKEIHKNRISLDELMCELRKQGVGDISEVKYAIIEQNGQISIILKAAYQQPALKDLGIKREDSGIEHIVIANGSVNLHGLEVISKDHDWLDGQLKKRHCDCKDVFLMTVNDSGNINFIKKDR